MRWLYEQDDYQIHPCSQPASLELARGSGSIVINRSELAHVISCLLVYLTTEAPG